MRKQIVTTLVLIVMLLSMVLGSISAVAGDTGSAGTEGLLQVDVLINELDADQVSTDAAEFVELYDGGSGNTDLSGLVLVFFNGNGDVSYAAFDLDGQSTGVDGYFVLCANAATTANCDLDVSPDTNLIQNGADAVALYTGDAASFPAGTAVTTANLVDAIVYGTDDPDDAGLLVLLNAAQPQVNEYGGGDATIHSNQRCPNGSGGARNTDTYIQATPTSGVTNNCPLQFTSIYDIQYTTDPSGDSPLKDQAGITTEGIVTGLFGSGYFVEDPAAGAWNGLWVHDTANTPALGDRLRLTGTVLEYYNLTELDSLTDYQVLSSGNPMPGPDVLATGDVSQEQWESVLVRVQNVTVTNENLGYGEWSVSDGSGDVILDDKGSYTYVPANGAVIYSITGPLDYSFGAFKMLPRNDFDIALQDYTPIYDIQYTTDPSGDSPFKDQAGITTEGIVTGIFQYGYFVEDPAAGPWNGLWVHDATNIPALGDRLRLTGTVIEYYNLTELDTLTAYMVESSGNPVPGPDALATGDVSQEQWESVLVRVDNVTVTNGDLGYGEWSVSDGSGDVLLDDKGSYTYTPTTGEQLAGVIGPLDYSFGAFKMLPRDDGDILPLDYTPIYDIQYTTDPSGDSPYKDQVGITTEGIVTGIFQYGYFIEEPAAGPWNGLWVHDTTNTPALGDRLRLTGTVIEYYNLTELDTLTAYQVESSGNPVPGPDVLATGDVSQEQWESVLVRVEDVTVTNGDLGYGEWSVSDGSGDVLLDDKGSYTYTPTTGEVLAAVIGPLDYGYGAFKMLPRDDGDIILPPPAWAINEILADPDSFSGDANGDGVVDWSDDEFVEMVNIGHVDLDISGWTLSDSEQVRHVFPAGTFVRAGCAVVVFGGGTPTGSFGNAVVQTASTGALSLYNRGDTVTLHDGITDKATYTYGPEGENGQSLTLDPDVTGTPPMVLHTTATGSGGAEYSPGTKINGDLFAGCVIGNCGDPATMIHSIQGSGLTSPMEGAAGVTVEAVVVADLQDTATEMGGFFLQEEDSDVDGDPLTSEGLFIRDDGLGIDVQGGDVVRVQGTVTENISNTELVSIFNLLICSSGATVSGTIIDLPVATATGLEHYEGMWVTFPEVLTASQNYFQGRYGQVTMSSEGRLYNPTNTYLPGSPEAIAMADENLRRMLILDDGMDVDPWGDNPDPIPYIGQDNTLRAGDTVAGLTGVLDEGWINSPSTGLVHYRLQPTEEVIFTRANARTAAPEDTGGAFKVASFNVLNYFNGDGQGGGFPTSRGANTLEEFVRQRTKIISATLALDADVIGLMEIENDGYGQYSAIQDLVNGMNDIAGPGTYAFVDPGLVKIGTDEIAVGLLYNATTVNLVGAAAILDSTVDPRFDDSKNRPALAQTFEDLATGHALTIAVNHLKSKGSACDDVGDPDTGDGQGNCNLTRTSAAMALADWLAANPTGSGDPDSLIIGDLNSYAMEDPITALKGKGYTNMVEAFLGMWTYTYTFDGQSGYLDHSLASPTLRPQVTGTTIWHINTDEPSVIDYNTEFKPQDLYTPTPYRASDHDPVVVSLDLRDVYFSYLPFASQQ